MMPTPSGDPQPGPAPFAYAARAGSFHPSPVRAVFDISMAPAMISLAGGNPDLGVLPLRELGDAAAALIAERGLECCSTAPAPASATCARPSAP